jgi:DNA-binding NarL/FixJ family response regulator
MIYTVIIDAKQEDREKINTLLTLHKDFDVQGLGKNGYDAIRLVTSFKPDIAILDIDLDLINGLDVVPLLKGQSPATLIVILASQLDDDQISTALSNEIAGFLLKGMDLDNLPIILKEIHFGKYYMSPQVSTRVFYIFSEILSKASQTNLIPKRTHVLPPGISRTELQIMRCIGAGRSNQEIAKYLNLKAGTVRNYISSAIHTTGVRDRTQIAIYALKNGLVSSDDTG